MSNPTTPTKEPLSVVISRAGLDLTEQQVDEIAKEPGKPLPRFIAWMREKGWDAPDEGLQEVWFILMESRIFTEPSDW